MARFGGTSGGQGAAGGGQTSIFGVMRNRAHQRPGKPVSMGERPEGRPMAADLGNGRSYATGETRRSDGRGPEPELHGATFGLVRPQDPTYFRRATGMALFSWER